MYPVIHKLTKRPHHLFLNVSSWFPMQAFNKHSWYQFLAALHYTLLHISTYLWEIENCFWVLHSVRNGVSAEISKLVLLDVHLINLLAYPMARGSGGLTDKGRHVVSWYTPLNFSSWITSKRYEKCWCTIPLGVVASIAFNKPEGPQVAYIPASFP